VIPKDLGDDEIIGINTAGISGGRQRWILGCGQEVGATMEGAGSPRFKKWIF